MEVMKTWMKGFRTNENARRLCRIGWLNSQGKSLHLMGLEALKWGETKTNAQHEFNGRLPTSGSDERGAKRAHDLSPQVPSGG